MRKLISISFLFFLVSCTQRSIGPENSVRAPASLGFNNPCVEAVASLMGAGDNISNPLLREEEIFARGILHPDAVKAVKEVPTYIDEILLTEGPETRNRAALIVALIRKKNPDMSHTQVVKRYHTLFNSCKL